jgi:ABC-2 type transport system permease protein
MFITAAVALPLFGLQKWAWQLPPDVPAAALFAVSITIAVVLSSALIMLLNISVLAALNDRGITALATPIVIVFSGNLLPLGLFPDAFQHLLRWQPFAGLIDIPLRIYFGQLRGIDALGGIALQAGWTLLLIAIGRVWMARAWRSLEVQGG